MRHHGRPWKCSVPDCEFAEGGFLSRKMRDKHLDHFHQNSATAGGTTIRDMDADEIQPFIFDVVQAENVEAFRALLPQFEGLPLSVKEELCKLAVSIGSVSLLDIMSFEKIAFFSHDLVKYAIQQRNVEVLHFLLSTRKDGRNLNHISEVLPEVLRSDSNAIYEEWEKHVDYEELKQGGPPPASRYITKNIIKATAVQSHREDTLLGVWKKLDLARSCRGLYIGDALVHITVTTCSVKLAKFVLGCGARVDHRRSNKYLTPLQNAVRQSSAEAARLTRYLLLAGANPEESSKAKLNIRDERGAKNISKWLNMSWDELIVDVREERQKQHLEARERSPDIQQVAGEIPELPPDIYPDGVWDNPELSPDTQQVVRDTS